MAEVRYALSLKQPWATLLVHGLKSIEVRRWSTPRLGRVLIHAARILDTRPEAWRHVPRELREHAEMVQGIVGSAELVGCREYGNPEAFAADAALHLNDASWFQPPVLYGFRFADPQRLPFRRYLGWMRFFKVEEEALA
jgi:ASCH domain